MSLQYKYFYVFLENTNNLIHNKIYRKIKNNKHLDGIINCIAIKNFSIFQQSKKKYKNDKKYILYFISHAKKLPVFVIICINNNRIDNKYSSFNHKNIINIVTKISNNINNKISNRNNNLNTERINQQHPQYNDPFNRIKNNKNFGKFLVKGKGGTGTELLERKFTLGSFDNEDVGKEDNKLNNFKKSVNRGYSSVQYNNMYSNVVGIPGIKNNSSNHESFIKNNFNINLKTNELKIKSPNKKIKN
jgi:hypothetical protein